MKTLTLFEDANDTATPHNGRRVQGGEATTDVIVSASAAGNAEVFADVARLHLPAGATVADVTYGKGVFWLTSSYSRR